MMRKKSVSFLLAMMFLTAVILGSFPQISRVEAQESDFVIKDGVIVWYTGSGGDIVIPDGVIGIGERMVEVQ